MKGFRTGYVDGDPQQVRTKLLAVADRYGTTDVSVVTNCYRFEDRCRSYQLIAEVMGLLPRE
jgi:hypothetical protein